MPYVYNGASYHNKYDVLYISYERRAFRQAKQETNSSLDQFITRLRKLTTYYEYGNNVNDEIKDQVIHTCKSTKLRTRLLQE